MSYLSGNQLFARELAEALGIKDCRLIELRVAVDEPVTLTTETVVRDDQGAHILRVVRSFDMNERIVMHLK